MCLDTPFIHCLARLALFVHVDSRFLALTYLTFSDGSTKRRLEKCSDCSLEVSLHYTLHSTLYTLHSTLHTLHCTLYTVHSTLHSLRSTLYTLHCTLYTLHSTLYNLHFTLYTLHLLAMRKTYKMCEFTTMSIKRSSTQVNRESVTLTGSAAERAIARFFIEVTF
jgi:hypothetical protein